MSRKVEPISNLDWAGVFRTMSERMALCESEEQMYQTLRIKTGMSYPEVAKALERMMKHET